MNFFINQILIYIKVENILQSIGGVSKKFPIPQIPIHQYSREWQLLRINYKGWSKPSYQQPFHTIPLLIYIFLQPICHY